MFYPMSEAIKAIDTAITRMKEAIGSIEGAAITQGPAVVFKDSKITIQAEVERNGTTVVAVETFTLDPDGDTAKTATEVIYPDDDSVPHHETAPHGSREEMVALIKRHTDRKNVKWFMTPEQYKSFQDHVKKLDCPDTIGDFGAVQVGRFLFLFNLENRRDRESNGYGPENHRIGTLYLAGIPKGKPFCGELDNGVRFTSLTDLVFQNFEEWMRGLYEIGDCPEDISKLTFPVFKDRMEEWVLDNAEVLKTVEDAIAKGEAPADMLTYVEPGWEAWMKSSSAKPTNAETEKDPFVQARAEMEAIFDKAKKDLDEICNRYIEKIKKL